MSYRKAPRVAGLRCETKFAFKRTEKNTFSNYKSMRRQKATGQHCFVCELLTYARKHGVSEKFRK